MYELVGNDFKKPLPHQVTTSALTQATILDWIERDASDARPSQVISVDRHHPDLVPGRRRGWWEFWWR